MRQLGDQSYEVSPHRTNLGLARNAAGNGESAQDSNGAAAPASASETAARPAALRFRRGSRAPVRPLELPLVGMVQVDDEPKAASAEPAVAAEKPAAPGANGRPRKRGVRSGSPKKEAVAEVAAAEPAEAKKPRRPRAKKSG